MRKPETELETLERQVRAAQLAIIDAPNTRVDAAVHRYDEAKAALDAYLTTPRGSRD